MDGMTRKELDHARYLKHRDERLKKQREYYRAHREYYESKAGMPIPYRGGMKALFIPLVCNVSFYCFFRDMSDALAIIRTRPQCREAAP